jgi:hypothetical protein
MSEMTPEEHVAAAFRHFGEARRDMTLWKLIEHIRYNADELGSHGFVKSIGDAIVDGASKHLEDRLNPKPTIDGEIVDVQ